MEYIIKNDKTISAVSVDSNGNHIIENLESFLEPTNKYNLLKIVTVDTDGNYIGSGGSIDIPKNKTAINKGWSVLSQDYQSSLLTNEYYKGLILGSWFSISNGDAQMYINADWGGGKSYQMIISEHITSTGFYSIKIYPGLIPYPNNISNEVLPTSFRYGIKINSGSAGCNAWLSWLL